MSKIGMLAGIIAVFALVAYAGAGNTTTFQEPGRGQPRSFAALLADSHNDLLSRHTENYVREDTDVSACELLQEKFAGLEAKGHGEFRLLALTAEPIVEANLPANDFEKLAAEHLRAGRTSFERTVTENGQPFLKATSAIAVSSKRCALCHPNFKGLPADQAVGAFSYHLPLD